MRIKKRVLVAGVLFTLSTSQAVRSDEVNFNNLPGSTNPPASLTPLQASSNPPVLLAPPQNVKELTPLGSTNPSGSQGSTTGPTLKGDDPNAGAGNTGVSPVSKLIPAQPGPVTSQPGLVPTRNAARQNVDADRSSEGFASLLAESGLQGWVVHEGRADVWHRVDDVISCRGSGGGWLRTEEEYSDFHLKFEYRLQDGSNSGVGIRCPGEGNPTFTGIELQLLDDTSPKYENLRPDQYTGSLYYQVPPLQKPKLRSVGEWNSCDIRCVGDQITVRINGELVNDVNLAKPSHDAPDQAVQKPWKLAGRPPIGHIALQSHTTQVEFRSLQLKDLSVKTESGVRYVELVTGEGETFVGANRLTVHYVGQLLDGTRFGDTRDLGDPVTVPLSAVIEGWKHGIEGMKVGGRRRLIVPPEMAYGSKGVTNLIPPGATLVFEVELCGFER